MIMITIMPKRIIDYDCNCNQPLGIDKTLKPFMDEIEIRFGQYLKILKR